MTNSSVRPPPPPDDPLDEELSALHQHIAHEPVSDELKASALALQKAVDAAGKPLAAAAGKG